MKNPLHATSTYKHAKKISIFQICLFSVSMFFEPFVLKTNDRDVALEEKKNPKLFKTAYVERNFDCPFRVFSFPLFHVCVWFIITFVLE